MATPVVHTTRVAGDVGSGDLALIHAAGRGDVPAQERLWRTHVDAVYRVCATQLASHDAEDAAADTFLAAFASWATFDASRGTARSWLLGIAANQMRLRWRRDRRLTATLERIRGSRSRSSDHVPFDDRVIARADARSVRVALDQLSASDRLVLVSQAAGDLGPDELAAVLGCTSGAAKVRLHRARMRLAAVLAPERSSGGDSHHGG